MSENRSHDDAVAVLLGEFEGAAGALLSSADAHFEAKKFTDALVSYDTVQCHFSSFNAADAARVKLAELKRRGVSLDALRAMDGLKAMITAEWKRKHPDARGKSKINAVDVIAGMPTAEQNQAVRQINTLIQRHGRTESGRKAQILMDKLRIKAEEMRRQQDVAGL